MMQQICEHRRTIAHMISEDAGNRYLVMLKPFYQETFSGGERTGE